ncbi:hypothetical protein PR048_018676 [Dryococelus australis]|uniref:Uncharacterized protein n=1 Tax=Dryococelus australis TaxID=614101 RepID=A0ABQ9HDQ2_9NEOP|nr:hypothetical protein PR048_018676 [Dryococelus australis]
MKFPEMHLVEKMLKRCNGRMWASHCFGACMNPPADEKRELGREDERPPRNYEQDGPADGVRATIITVYSVCGDETGKKPPGRRSKVKVINIQHGGKDGHWGTGMTEHKQLQCSTPYADVSKSSNTFSSWCNESFSTLMLLSCRRGVTDSAPAYRDRGQWIAPTHQQTGINTTNGIQVHYPETGSHRELRDTEARRNSRLARKRLLHTPAKCRSAVRQSAPGNLLSSRAVTQPIEKYFAACSSQSDTRSICTASRSQSQKRFADQRRHAVSDPPREASFESQKCQRRVKESKCSAGDTWKKKRVVCAWCPSLGQIVWSTWSTRPHLQPSLEMIISGPSYCLMCAFRYMGFLGLSKMLNHDDAKTSRPSAPFTLQQSATTDLQHFGTMFANQHLVTYPPAGSTANKESLAGGTQWPIRHNAHFRI